MTASGRMTALSKAGRSGAGAAERLLVTAMFITCLGDSIQLTASALLVVRSERTTLAVGWLFISVAIPQAALSAYFGHLVDRFDRRMLCIICDATSALVALALPVWLLLGGAANIAAYLTNFALAIISALFLPAIGALIKERVRDVRLRSFNANFEVATQAGTLLSSGVGGFMVQLYGVKPLFFFNAVTFVASAVCMTAMGKRPAATTAGPVQADAQAVAASHPPLLRLGLLYALGNPVITISNTVLVVLVIQVFGQGAGTLGVVDALAGVGFLVAAAAYKRASQRASDLGLVLFGYLASAVFITLQPQFGVIALLFLLPLGTLTFGVARVAARTMLMRAVEESRAGRVFGATNTFGLTFSVAATLAVSGVADHTQVRFGFVSLAVLMAVVAVPAVISLRRSAVLPIRDAALTDSTP